MPRGAGGGMGGGMGGGRSLGGGMGGGRSLGGGSRGGMSGGGRTVGRSGGGMGGSGGGMGGRPPGGGMPRGGGGSGAGGFLTGMLLGNMMGSNRGGGGGPRPPQEPRNDNQNGGGGFGSGCAVIIIAIVLIIVVFGIFGGLANGGCSSSNITASTVEREKLPSSYVNETNYYTDDGGWGITNSVTSGLKSFYNETGVQPYLYLLDDGYSSSELQSMANDYYDELFTDEGHYLFLISAQTDNYNYYNYDAGYEYADLAGSQAKTVMDNEAREILLDYIDKYYFDYNIEDNNEVFSKAFEDAGKRIMTKTTQPIDLVVPIVICIVIVIIAIIIFVTLRRRRQHETEERERTERILSTPLEKYNDSDLEDLEKKYEKSSSDTDSDVKVSTSESSKEAEDEPLQTYGDKDVEDLAKEYEEKDGESQTGDE